jgi:hypothetical protein
MQRRDYNGSMTRGRRWLSALWWPIGPAFALVTTRFAIDRACGDPYYLVPTLASRPLVAWMVAAVYVLAHIWLLLAYLDAARTTASLLPTYDAVNGMWGRHLWKPALLVVATAIEYAPMALFRAAARLCG